MAAALCSPSLQMCCCRPLLPVSDCVSSFQISPDDYKDGSFMPRTEEADIDVRKEHSSVVFLILSNFQVWSPSLCVCVSLCVSDQAEQTVWAGQDSEDAGGKATAATQREGTAARVQIHVFDLRRCICAIMSICVCMCACGSTLWRQPCCQPVRSWVNRAGPTLQADRAWSSRETCCRTACSAPAESCPESMLWAHPNTLFHTYITARHVGQVYWWKTTTDRQTDHLHSSPSPGVSRRWC